MDSWQWAGILSAACMVAWALAGVVWVDTFLRVVSLNATAPRGHAEASALYIGAFGGVGCVALLANTPEAYAVTGGMWLGMGTVRIVWSMLYWQIDRYIAAAIPFELAFGALGIAAWAAA